MLIFYKADIHGEISNIDAHQIYASNYLRYLIFTHSSINSRIFSLSHGADEEQSSG